MAARFQRQEAEVWLVRRVRCWALDFPRPLPRQKLLLLYRAAASLPLLGEGGLCPPPLRIRRSVGTGHSEELRKERGDKTRDKGIATRISVLRLRDVVHQKSDTQGHRRASASSSPLPTR